MFNLVLVTLDGSPYGERALSYVASLALPTEARVVLLTVRPEQDSTSQQKHQSYLDGHATVLRDEGLTEVETEIGVGEPAIVIVETARRLGADLIVMSTQGVSAQTDQGLGGVASKILMSAPCPVFMVRIQRPQPARGPAEERWQFEGGANVG